VNKPVVEQNGHVGNRLIDRFGREVSYVRLSVTDRCDFRCVYCMAEEMKFLPKTQILSLEEIYSIAESFVSLGVTKIRLTGGEPLVRKGIMKLIARLGAMPGLERLVMTTNGSQVARYAADLRRLGVKRLNISVDSLRSGRFRELTRTGDLNKVLRGVDAAIDAGFERIKLNAVIMRGRNDDEIIDLVNFARDKDIDISFIEEMPLGAIDEHNRQLAFISSAELRRLIAEQYPLKPVADSTGGPSKYYKMDDSNILVGFISPHSHNFCHLCNRVRVTVEGRLLLCLGNEHSVSLRDVLRLHPDNKELLQKTIRKAMDLKPQSHHFELDADPQILRFMNMTGG
jgi:cyclic pyranopterin phosphate synthase